MLAVLALAIAAYAAFHYKAPTPRRELLHVTGTRSVRTPSGASKLTSAPDLATTAAHRVYGISRAEAPALARGGWFTCTVTKPIKNRSPDAADCTPAAAPAHTPAAPGS